MSKVICDVCGTAYPDTATQCPICGCVRTAASQSVPGSSGDRSSGDGYTYVKGGRFSKANVRKRNSANGVVSVNMVNDERKRQQKKSGGDNKGLVIAAIVLFLAIIAVVLFITVRFLLNSDDTGADSNDPKGSVVDTGEDSEVLCEEIYFDMAEITFKEADATEKLVVTVLPEDCTEELKDVVSEDPKVATAVLKDSVVTVTAVGPGETKIKLTCGSYTAVCTVVCDFEEEKELVLTEEELLFTKKGEQADIYPSDILRTDIEWTSADETVATVSHGTVTAVGEGETVIRAKYNDQIVECKVKCEFTEDEDGDNNTGSGNQSNNDSIISGTGGVTEDGGSTPAASAGIDNPWSADNTGSMEQVGSEFTLFFKDENGNRTSNVTWSSSNESCCTVSGGVVKCVGTGEATITATYNGQNYTFKITVS